MNLKKLIFTKNRCYKAGRTIKPKGIMVHSTGANNPNLKRYVGPDDGLLGKNTAGNHWNKSNISVCVHAFIGKLKDGSIATYQTLPWNHRGWHAGGSANDTHISFEICEDGLKDKTYFNKVYKEAVELCAYLCKKYDLSPKTIICHSEGYKKGIASNHGDVMHWFPKHGKSMDTFRADVKALLESEDKPAVETKPAEPVKKEETKKADELDVDGEWGKATTTRLQQIFGTPVDGIVSNQLASYKADNPGLASGWDWDDKPNGKGSSLIKAMQKWAGMPAKKRDGEFGPETCRAIQKKLGTPVDGVVSNPSAMVKALQKWANKQDK